MTPVEFPPLVFRLWQITVILGWVVFLPLSVYWLHSLWRAARSIRHYARESAEAAEAIRANAGALPALDQTIAVATEVLQAAESAAARLDQMAAALESRAGRV